MKSYDFIKQAIGNKVYIIGDGDLGLNSELRDFIYEKTELKLIKLTKGGMCIVEYNSKQYSVPPRNVREIIT